MSDAPIKIWTRCPRCRSKYSVAPKAVGHHARCRKCNTPFLVVEYNPHPSEDDILRWLNEVPDEPELSAYPRVISGPQRGATPIPAQVTARNTVTVPNVGARPN